MRQAGTGRSPRSHPVPDRARPVLSQHQRRPQRLPARTVGRRASRRRRDRLRVLYGPVRRVATVTGLSCPGRGRPLHHQCLRAPVPPATKVPSSGAPQAKLAAGDHIFRHLPGRGPVRHGSGRRRPPYGRGALPGLLRRHGAVQVRPGPSPGRYGCSPRLDAGRDLNRAVARARDLLKAK